MHSDLLDLPERLRGEMPRYHRTPNLFGRFCGARLYNNCKNGDEPKHITKEFAKMEATEDFEKQWNALDINKLYQMPRKDLAEMFYIKGRRAEIAHQMDRLNEQTAMDLGLAKEDPERFCELPHEGYGPCPHCGVVFGTPNCVASNTVSLTIPAPERAKLVSDICYAMGRMLQQEYRQHDGKWWLYTRGKPARELKADEVQWHLDRNHAPFVSGGVTPNDAEWWNDPT
jgi:hypothetical protein